METTCYAHTYFINHLHLLYSPFYAQNNALFNSRLRILAFIAQQWTSKYAHICKSLSEVIIKKTFISIIIILLCFAFAFFAYLEICVQKICYVTPRGKSWAGLGVASQRSADAVGGILRAGEEPRWVRGGSSSPGTPGPGCGRGTWPVVEPGNCSLRHLSSGWSNLKPSGGWDPLPLEGSL